ncbi:MAG: CBS domain-containing membrane protein [Neolewinella sp.]|jgi:CBS domain-containing protein
MKKRMPVSKIMSTGLLTVNITQRLKEVEAIIRGQHVRHVPVVSGDKIIGMLSKTDLQKISFVNMIDGDDLTTAMYDNLSIEQVMTKDITTVKQDDTILDVATILSENEFHALPVTEDGKLVGIVTTSDLVKFLIDLY